MPLDFFKSKQALTFKVVAKKHETTWNPPTLCLRLLLPDGSELEGHFVREAISQFEALPLHVSFSMDVLRGLIKPYKRQSMTGIASMVYLRTQYKVHNLQRNAQPFSADVYQNRTYVRPENIAQQEDGTVFNIAGYVEDIEAVTGSTGGTILPRRNISLRYADWVITLALLGDNTAKDIPKHTNVFVVSVKKNSYLGLNGLETTRLSWMIAAPSWLQVSKAEEGSPVRKALRCEALLPVKINTLQNAQPKTAHCVDASMVPYDEELFTRNIWFGPEGKDLRLPISLRDDSGTLFATLWSVDLYQLCELNLDEFNALWESGAEKQDDILNALNQFASQIRRWTLRTSEWAKNSGDSVIQWHVQRVNAIDNE